MEEKTLIKDPELKTCQKNSQFYLNFTSCWSRRVLYR